VQRCSSDLRLNPHAHGIFLDGVFVPGPDGGRPVFHPLPHISSTAVADVLQIARSRILKLLSRRDVVEISDDLVTVTGDLADRDPATPRSPRSPPPPSPGSRPQGPRAGHPCSSPCPAA
jgi:hypothetical protein